MKRGRKNGVGGPSAPSGRENPSVVREAFGAGGELVLTMEGVLLLEEIESPYLRAMEGAPRLRDLIVCYLVLTDAEVVRRAWVRDGVGGLGKLVVEFSRGMRPPEVLALAMPVAEAIRAAFAPVEEAVEGDELKK